MKRLDELRLCLRERYGKAVRIAKNACVATGLDKILHSLRAWRPSALLALGLLSALLTLLTFRLHTADACWQDAFHFLGQPLLFALNWLPLLLTMYFWYHALGRPSVAFALAAVPALALTLVNYYKLLLRGDPLLYADIGLIGEASAMSGRYAILPTAGVVFAALSVIAATVLLQVLYRHTPRPSGLRRIIGSATSAALLLGYLWVALPADALYARTGLACSWLPTQSYEAHGVIYPFLRSIRDAQNNAPEGYDECDAAAELSAYAEDDIPDDRKVDVIVVMLEAFNDFSAFDTLDFDVDPYADLHAIEAEGYSGQLVVNVFAGETVNTERAFLTGYLDPSDSFRKPVNSFVWYLRGQGYACVGNHPGYNWFYNRLNVNEYLGFEQYHFYENRYRQYVKSGQITPDAIFLPTLITDYDAAKESGQPVFSFNVSYQNHGPYSGEKAYDTAYLPWKEGYDEADYHIANNYLSGVEETCRQLRAFVDHFRQEERPVVLVFFGDHNPWWGDGNSAYQMFGINLDLSTEEGFYNYYCTPYVIWANDAAKAALGDSFSGKGDRISPSFLMERLFTLAGWDGPAYMKALRALETKTPFLNRACRLENGALAGSTSATGEDPEWLRQFRNIEYYQKNAGVSQAQTASAEKKGNP